MSQNNLSFTEHQRTLIKKAVWHSCLNCQHFNTGYDVCMIYKQKPPLDVIVSSCAKWEELLPF